MQKAFTYFNGARHWLERQGFRVAGTDGFGFGPTRRAIRFEREGAVAHIWADANPRMGWIAEAPAVRA